MPRLAIILLLTVLFGCGDGGQVAKLETERAEHEQEIAQLRKQPNRTFLPINGEKLADLIDGQLSTDNPDVKTHTVGQFTLTVTGPSDAPESVMIAGLIKEHDSDSSERFDFVIGAVASIVIPSWSPSERLDWLSKAIAKEEGKEYKTFVDGIQVSIIRKHVGVNIHYLVSFKPAGTPIE